MLCNPAWSAAERHARDWAVRVGLVNPGQGTRRLAQMGLGRLAGYLAPSADPAELNLLARWTTFIALVDDLFDSDAGVAPRGLLDQLIAVISDQSGWEESQEPAVGALAGLWRDTRVSASRDWTERFVAHYRAFAEATVAEIDLRDSGEPVGVGRYLAMRRQTITALPMLDIIERRVPVNAALDRLRELTADIIGWANDLASFEADLREGHANLVGEIATAHGCDLDEAAARVRHMIAARMDCFDAETPTRAPHCATDAIRSYRDGALAWQAETGRADRERHFAHAPAVPGIDRLVEHLSLAVTPGGSVPNDCAGRVLESSLLLALLRTRGDLVEEQQELIAFLARRRPHADALDATLIGLSLGDDDVGDFKLAEGAGDWRSRLKHTMFRIVLHLLHGAPLSEQDAPPPVPADQISTFTEVNLLSAQIIHSLAVGRPHAASPSTRSRLLRILGGARDRLVWEGSTVNYLLGLHAVQRFRPHHPVLVDGIMGVLLTMNRDGGVRPYDGQDLWLAPVVGLAFLTDDRLRPFTARIAHHIATWQADDGGWPFAAGVAQTDVDTTNRCVEFLHGCDARRYAKAIERAGRYLAHMADPGGGFPTWKRGNRPDLDMAAGAVIALTCAGARRYRAIIDRAVGFIASVQRANGTFETTWSISESSVILRVLDALDLAASGAAVANRSLDRLRRTQNPDGGWGHGPGRPSDALSTAQAITALAKYAPEPVRVRAALAFLMSRQRADGSFESIPDQVGPRPVPFDYPVLANVHALTAIKAAGH